MRVRTDYRGTRSFWIDIRLYEGRACGVGWEGSIKMCVCESCGLWQLKDLTHRWDPVGISESKGYITVKIDGRADGMDRCRVEFPIASGKRVERESDQEIYVTNLVSRPVCVPNGLAKYSKIGSYVCV
jgi:hypothetical protein